MGSLRSLIAITTVTASLAALDEELIVYTPQSSVFHNQHSSKIESINLVAFVRPQSSAHSAFFHPTLWRIKNTLESAGLHNVTGYIDLDDPLTASISAKFAIRTVPSLMLFLPHAPSPIPLEYTPTKTASDIAAEVLDFAMRVQPLADVPRLPKLNTSLLVSAPGGGFRKNESSIMMVENAEGGGVQTSSEPVTSEIDRQLGLLEILQRRLIYARSLAEEAASVGSHVIVQKYNRHRGTLMASGSMVDREQLLKALEEMSTLAEFLPQ